MKGNGLILTGEIVAENNIVWNAVALPSVLNEYVNQERAQLPNQWNHSLVIGYDYYHYTKSFWFHSWASVLPFHVSTQNEYSYSNFIDGNTWFDYTGGLILGVASKQKIRSFLTRKIP